MIMFRKSTVVVAIFALLPAISWAFSTQLSRKTRSHPLLSTSTRLSLKDAESEQEENGFHVDRREFVSVGSVAALTAGIFSATGPQQLAWALDADETKRIAIFEKTSPSVVFIDTFAERRDALTTNIMEVPLGSGSGFVWDKQGHIVTNYHVVRNSRLAQVTILLSAEIAAKAGVSASTNEDGGQSGGLTAASSSSFMSSSSSATNTFTSMRPLTGPGAKTTVRKVYTAKIVGVDPGKDIAVLKIDADENVLFPISVGTSTGLKVGQGALAIGNPFGLDHTLTLGIISGTGREVKSPIGRPITDVIQTDAAINPGNSGGPLLDTSGKLIGMNTAIYSPSGASSGIGFAIPIDVVKFIVDTLIRDGKVVRPVLGISYLGSKQARALGITTGVLVLEVPPGSNPAKAGLKGTRRTETGLIELGDIITEVNGRAINVEGDLFQALENCKPGDVVEVKVYRVVAIADELAVREKVLQIELSESSKFEKSFGPP